MKDNEKTNNGEGEAAESSALYAAPEEPIAAGEVPAKSYFEKFLDQRFALVETKINSLKELFQHVLAQIDKRFEEINWRFEQVDRRFGDVDKRLDNLAEKIDRLSDKMDGLYKWVIGLIAGTFLTYLASIIFR